MLPPRFRYIAEFHATLRNIHYKYFLIVKPHVKLTH